jgi:hypothetical protein
MLKIDFETTITLFIMVIFVTSYENFFLLIGFALGVALTLLMNPIGHYFGVRKEFRVVQLVYLVTNIALPIFLVYSVIFSFLISRLSLFGCILQTDSMFEFQKWSILNFKQFSQ